MKLVHSTFKNSLVILHKKNYIVISFDKEPRSHEILMFISKKMPKNPMLSKILHPATDIPAKILFSLFLSAVWQGIHGVKFFIKKTVFTFNINLENVYFSQCQDVRVGVARGGDRPPASPLPVTIRHCTKQCSHTIFLVIDLHLHQLIVCNNL